MTISKKPTDHRATLQRLRVRAEACPPGEGTDCALAACAVMARLLDAIEVGKGLHGKDRETLGKLVHEVENAWRRDERGDHPNNLSDWDELDAGYQEVACLIGEAVANHMFFGDHGAGEPLPDAWLRCLTTGVHESCPHHEDPKEPHDRRSENHQGQGTSSGQPAR